MPFTNIDALPLPAQVPAPPEGLLDRDSFHKEWDTEAYLKDFYTNVDDPAMKMVLFFLPNIVARVGPVKTVLDFGAGPTVHVAVAFRQTADEIYLADYLPGNRDELEAWRNGRSKFDWTKTMQKLANAEGAELLAVGKMEKETRPKVMGVFHCDCFASPAVQTPKNVASQFDVVVTIFCIEYCCNSYEEYARAIANICDTVKPGGRLIMGGIFEETWCSFGGRKFTCLYITEAFMKETLRQCGMETGSEQGCIFYEINGMFMICARRRHE